MSTTTTSMRTAAPDALRERNRTLDRLFDRVVDAAHASDDARAQAQKAEAAVQHLDTRHPQYATSSLRVASRRVVVLAALPAAALLDYLLDAPTIVYFARSAELGPDAVPVARVGIPAVVVCLEAAVNVTRSHAHERWRDGLSGSGAFLGWTAVAIAAGLASTALVASSVLANGAPTLGRKLLMGGVMGLTALTHAAVLFGPLEDAKGWAMFSGIRRWHRSKQAHAEKGRTGHARVASQAFGRYVRLIDESTGQFANQPHVPGPFDRVTRDVVNSELGYDAIPAPVQRPGPPPLTPNAGAQTGPATDSSPNDSPASQGAPAAATTAVQSGDRTAEAGGAADAELEYLRDVLRRRMRDDESAVTA